MTSSSFSAANITPLRVGTHSPSSTLGQDDRRKSTTRVPSQPDVRRLSAEGV